MNVVKRERQVQIVSMLVEGNSIRSIERVTGTHRDTIMRLLVRVGDHCHQIHDRHMQSIRSESVQVDEIWCYVAKKQKAVRRDDPADFGDAYTFVAMDAHSKLVPCYLVGKRCEGDTHVFMRELSRRLEGRTQLTSDGYGPYPKAVRASFNGRADYAQIVKEYQGGTTDDEHRYSPPRVVSANHKWVSGRPKYHLVSTSHIERQNLTIRMHMRRFTRLTNAFSKKLDNLRAAVDLHFVWYNFVRIHRSLGMTPAMAHGIVSRVWSIDRLLPDW